MNLEEKNALYEKQLRENATIPEKEFAWFLAQEHIQFNFQQGFLKPFHRIVDFYLPGLNLVVEIDGSSHKGSKGLDDRKDKTMLENFGIKTIRLTNRQVFSPKLKEIFRFLINKTEKTARNLPIADVRIRMMRPNKNKKAKMIKLQKSKQKYHIKPARHPTKFLTGNGSPKISYYDPRLGKMVYG